MLAEAVCVAKTVLADEPAVFPGSPTSIKTVHIIGKFAKTFDLIGKSGASLRPWNFGSQ